MVTDEYLAKGPCRNRVYNLQLCSTPFGNIIEEKNPNVYLMINKHFNVKD